jgi:hypothetical protein
MAVVMDSTRYDAMLGIGVFKYWRYSKLKFLSWLPFIPDERDEGIELIKKTIRADSVRKFMAMHQLIDILTDYGQTEEAGRYARQLAGAYPESQFMLWAAAHAFDKNDDFSEAEATYLGLDSLLMHDSHVNPNHLIKCRMKLAALYQRMNDRQGCFDTCNGLLALLDRLNVNDREDKAEDIRELLDECGQLVAKPE